MHVYPIMKNDFIVLQQVFDASAFDGDFTVLIDLATTDIVVQPSRYLKFEFINREGSYFGLRYELIGTPLGTSSADPGTTWNELAGESGEVMSGFRHSSHTEANANGL